MQTLYKKADIQDVIMHHGVKGMKWGVTRARNSVGMTMAKSSRQQVASAVETYKNARDIEKEAGRITGRGNSTARMAAGKWASERANRERNNADRDSSAGAFNGNRVLSNISNRNQNKLSKLEAKAKKTGNPKDKQNAEAFRAYANEVEKRSKGIRKDINDNYAKSQQARSESFKARDEYLKAVEKYVYRNTNVQRPNINKVNDDNYKKYSKQVNDMKQEIKKRNQEFSHSDRVDEILMHYGTKGMKWGQRHAIKKVDKFESKGKKKSESLISDSKAHLKKSKELDRDDSFKEQLVGGLAAGRNGTAYVTNREKAQGHAAESARSAHNAYVTAAKYGQKMDHAIAKAKKKGVDTKNLERKRETFRAYEKEVMKRANDQKTKSGNKYRELTLKRAGLSDASPESIHRHQAQEVAKRYSN